MNGLFFYIGLGLGLAVACGLRPYLPALLAGALSSSSALNSSSRLTSGPRVISSE